MALALARKYRPTSFDGLIGQEAVSQTLSLALDSDRLSHAYLFSGLRGSGKTSTARIFAKALLCEKGTTSNPCEVCTHCIMANESRHIDIIEMDGASNRKIDDIRELIEHTKYKPSIARYKIFIIDEVHMLTKEAFNALLKTLEEPPEFVKFILATTDPLKLPATILSRTQHFRFRKISKNILVKHLAHILNLEGVGYKESALEVIARSGAGSVRDSLTLLDQAIVYSKNFIDIATVTSMLGIIEPSILEALLDSIFKKDKIEILKFIKDASEFESEMVIDELMLYLKETLLDDSHKISPMIIERFFRVLADSKILLNMGSDGEFVLSLTLFKMMEALDIEDIESMIRSLEKELSGVKVETIKSEVKISKPSTTTLAPKKEDILPPKVIEKPIDNGERLFKELVEKIYDRNYELGEVFKKNITYRSFIDNYLTWESSAFGKDKVFLRNSWGFIRLFVQEIFGVETKITNIAKESTPPLKSSIERVVEPISMVEDEILNQSIDNHDINMQTGGSSISSQDGEVESVKEKTILDEPMVAKALELFAPKTVRVKRKG